MSLFSLDSHTAFLLAGVMCLLAGLAVYTTRVLHPPARAAIGCYASGLTTGGVSLLLVPVLGPWVTEPTARMIDSIVGDAAIVLVLEGARQLYGHPPRLSMTLMTICFVSLIHAISPSPLFTGQLHLLLQASCALMAAVYIALGEDPHAPNSRWVLLLSFALLSVSSFGRLALLATTSESAIVAPADSERLDGLAAIGMLLFMTMPALQASLLQTIASRRQIALMSYQAGTDELTGAASRRFLFARAESWLQRSQSACPGTALMMIDIDDLKAVNDRHGHEAGDQALRHVAQVLQRSLRRDSLLARYTGEEFCALVPVADEEEARLLADRLRRAIEAEPLQYGGLVIPLTVSIGMAMHRAGTTLNDVLRAADRRVYEAKLQGRNRVIADGPALAAAIV